MKKLLLLAVAAILAMNISAQEAKGQKAECKNAKKECKLSKEEKQQLLKERTEKDIRFLSQELYLSEEQEASFAQTYREYIEAKVKLNEEFAKKFGKTLNERQVKAVLRYHGPKHKGPKGGDFKHGEGPKEKQFEHAHRSEAKDFKRDSDMQKD